MQQFLGGSQALLQDVEGATKSCRIERNLNGFRELRRIWREVRWTLNLSHTASLSSTRVMLFIDSHNVLLKHSRCLPGK